MPAPTTAPRHVLQLDVRLHDAKVGLLEQTDAGVFFTYTPEWLRGQIELSARNWPLRNEPFPPGDSAVGWGLPGFIADSLPDAFGKEVALRYFAENGLINPSPLDLLAIVGERGMGALTYHPASETDPLAPPFDIIDAIQLGRLAKESEDVIKRLSEGKISSILLRDGASIGGARPKMRLCIGADGNYYTNTSKQAEQPGAQHWIVKFDSGNAGWGTVELAYSQMARAAGIDIPETRLITAQKPDGTQLKNFAIRRFDRDAAERRHYHSAAGYFNRSIAPLTTQGDYAELFAALAELGAPASDKEELLRRCAFNVLAHNLDDHFKNFGFCMTPDGAWRLSPAFDLCYLQPGQHWLDSLGRCSTVDGHSRRIRRRDILSLASAANITRTKARQIADQVAAAVEQWQTHATAAGVDAPRLAQIQSSLNETKADFGA
jgi:serine/threonine-protein kinase HipA